MKDRLKRITDKLKTFVEAWKIWIFLIALIGTNGGQQMYYHEPEAVDEKPIVKVKPTIIKPQKTIIIHKFDAELAKKLIKLELDKHKNGSQH